MKKSRDERYSLGKRVYGIVIACMVTEGRYTCEHSTMRRRVESLCCTPEANIILYVNYTSVKKRKKYGSL